MAMKLYSDVDIENIAHEIRKKLGARLPKEYVEVEYLQSEDGARIATGVSGGNDDIKIECKFLTTGFSTYSGLFGNFSTNDHNCTRLIFSTTETSFLSYVNTKGSGGGITNSNIAIGEPHVLLMTQSETIIDGITRKRGAVTKGTENDTEMSVFSARVTAASPTSYKTRMYYFRIYDGDTLLRNFIPCYRKSDNVAGMYDIVNNVFYTPYQNVGYFTTGSEVYDKYKISEMADAIAQLNVINI